MICSGCGEKNREGARFCMFCGAGLATRCGVCDTELISGARFCDSCGAPVGASAAEPAPAARKVVTIIFSDLTGSTALEERMDAESVRVVLDRFYSAMRRETERHGGTVVKFTGDGAMSAFGIPDVKEDDASRAIDAALAMQAECEELAADLGLPLALKIGINTGEVVVSETDEDVVGDSVNVAARLEGAAGAGEILVGEETWRLTRGTSRYEAIPPLTLKGKSEPVPAYRLLAVDERTADSATAPFVGRDHELGRMLAVFQDAVDSNAARLITIIGAPGLGKTRLTRELMLELEGQARIRETRCDPGGAATFAPIADALRGAASIADSATEEEVVDALLSFMPPDADDRERVAQRAAAILGAGVAGSTEETFWAIRRLIETAAQAAPVVLVLDDIHWAEPLLLDLIEHLAEWIKDAPVLLVGTARPELRDVRPALAEGGRAGTVISLEGLDEAATARLALNLLGADELPRELLAKIPASTEGNPLFVREFVRMLVDDGVLLRGPEGWSVTVDVEAIQVPPTIQSLLAARVDRLRADERAFLEIAAVIGKEFYRGALQELAPPAIRDHVEGCLESLRRKELVEPAGTYWIDEPVYRFHHVLIRDAAYRRLLKESRADVHERTAAWLERKTADVLGEHDELIGYHLEQAYENKRQLGRPDPGLALRASALLAAAAGRALDRDDLPAAAALSGRALDVLPPDDDSRAELLLVRCEALLSIGDVVAGAEALDALREVASTPRLEAWATCFAAQVAGLTGRHRSETVTADLAEAASLLERLGDQAGAAKAHTVRAKTLAGHGRFAECEAVLDDALNAARAANDRRRITAVLGAAPHAALWGPSPVSRAGGRCLDITRLLRITTGSPAVEATSTRCQAVLEGFRGRADAARRMLRSSRRTLTELGLRHELLETDQFAGIVALAANEPHEAIDHLTSAYEGCVALGVDALAAQSAALLARAHLAVGDVEAAKRSVAESERLGSHDLKASIDWRSVKAEILAREGRVAEARELAETAVQLASETDALIDHGQAYRALANVCAAFGDAEGARAATERANALFERKGATALLEVTASPTQTTAAAPPVTPPADEGNAALRSARALAVAITTGDWDRVAAHVRDDVSIEDRRHLTGVDVSGRDAYVDQARTLLEVGAVRIESALIAERGERLALIRCWYIGGEGASDPFQVELLQLFDYDEAGLLESTVLFDAYDLGAALAELEARYIAAEGAPFTKQIEAAGAAIGAMDRRDWAGMRAALSPGFVFVDHSPAGRGEQNLDEYIAGFRALAEMLPDSQLVFVRFETIGSDGWIGRLINRGSSLEAADVELENLAVTVFRDGRICRIESFPTDRMDAALGRFEELVTSVDPPSNACTKMTDELLYALARKDVDRYLSCHADSFVHDDRRTGVRHVMRDHDALRENVEAIWSMDGEGRVDIETLAIRGDRLALSRKRHRLVDKSGDPTYEIVRLTVDEIDEHGRAAVAIVFDADDVDAAFAELEDRYWAQIGDPPLELVLTRRLVDAMNTRDWDALRAVFGADFTFVDHSPAARGTLDADAYVASVRELMEIAPDIRTRVVQFEGLAPGLTLGQARNHGVSTHGGEVEISYHVLGVTAPDGIVAMEMFPIDEFERARARFDELRGRPPLENRCTRLVDELFSAFERKDLEAFLACHAETFVHDDRRSGVRHVINGTQELTENAQANWGVGLVHADIETLAIRGERLALNVKRYRYMDPDGDVSYEAPQLFVDEIDESGRAAVVTVFDPDDIVVALAELETRYAAGEAAAMRHNIEFSRDFVVALNSRDIETLRSIISDDGIVMVDRRPASFGELDREEYLRSLAATFDIADFRAVTRRYLELHDGVNLAEVSLEITTEGGAPYRRLIAGLLVTAGGRIRRIEIFPIEDVDAARARVAEFLSRPGARVTNLATAAGERFYEAFYRRDWDALAALAAPDVFAEDMRTGIRSAGRGADRLVDSTRVIADVGVEAIDVELLAIRGDRLMLSRLFFRNAYPDAILGVGLLQVAEVDEQERFTYVGVLDEHDLDRAYALLDERFIAIEGDACRDAIDASSVFVEAHTARDLPVRWREVLAPGMRVIDHRPASAGEIVGLDSFIRFAEAFLEQAPDTRVSVPAIYRVCPVAALGSMVGASQGGVLEYLTVSTLSGGLVVRTDVYPAERFDDAARRFDEIERMSSTACYRTCARLTAAAGVRDWDGFAALVAPDVVIEDRRAGMRNELRGVGDAVAAARGMHDLGVRRASFEPLAMRGDRLLLSRYTFHSSDPSFDYDTTVLLLIEVDEEGRCVAQIVFDPNDLDDAIAELEVRFSPGRGRREVGELANLVGDASLHLTTALNARDWDAVRALVSEDIVHEDRRRGLSSRGVGVDPWIRNLRVVIEDMGLHIPDRTVIAIRGERLGLATVDAVDANGSVLASIAVGEAGPDGRMRRIVHFDADAVDDALVELNRCFAASEGAHAVEVIEWLSASDRAYNARDWDAFSRGFAADVRFIDHRPASAGTTIGVRNLVSYLRGLIELVPNARILTTDVVTVSSDHMVRRGRVTGTASDGGEVDLEFHLVERFANGVCTSFETFSLDQRDEALRAVAPRRLDNLAVSTSRRRIAAFLERDLAVLASVHAPDAVLEDRRALFKSRYVGRDEVREVNAGIAAVGVTDVESKVLATRGSRIALTHMTMRGSRFESVLLNLEEVDASGLITTLIAFDPADLDDAFAELDARYIAGEGAPYADVLRAGVEQRAALTRGDFDAYRLLMSEDIVLVDNRRVSLGEVRGVDDVMAALHAAGPLRRNLKIRVVAYHATAADRVLVEVKGTGIAPHGGDVEQSHLRLQHHVGGKVVRAELFEVDDLNRALQRFEALATDSPGSRLENSATRAAMQRANFYVAGDPEGAAGLFADDAIVEDRRPGLRSSGRGRADVDLMVGVVAGLGITGIDQTWLATRGDRLVLHRDYFRGSRFDSEVLAIDELDAEGRISAMIAFAADDLDAAYEELDARFARDLSPRQRLGLQRLRDFATSYQSRDFDAIRRALSPDLVFVDHQPASAGKLVGADAFISYVQQLVDVAPGWRADIVAVHALTDEGGVFEALGHAETDDGERLELTSLYVATTDEEVRAERLENFPVDQLDRALARFEELTASRHAAAPTLAQRAASRWSRAVERGDADGALELFTPDVVAEDRRRGFGLRAEGVDQLEPALRQLVDIGIDRVDHQPLATRGERLVLSRNVFSSRRTDAYEVEGLHLVEVDEQGLIRASTFFDGDDLDSAFAELDALYMTQLSPAEREIVRLTRELSAALRDRDLDRFRAFLAPDVRLVDHRPASAGEVAGADNYLAFAGLLLDMAPDWREDWVAVHAINADGGVFEALGQGTTPDGAHVEIALLYVGVLDEDRKIGHFEVFAVEELAEALARFEALKELNSVDGAVMGNRATEAVSAVFSAPGASFLAHFSDEVVLDDRRSGVRHISRGRDEIDRNARAVASVGYGTPVTRVLAIRGSRLALCRQSWSTDDGFAADVLNLFEVDDGGKIRLWVAFDAGAADDAFVELENRFVAGEGAAGAAFVRAREGIRRAWNGEGWTEDVLSRYVAPDFLVVDHRPLGAGRIEGRAAWIAYTRPLWEESPGLEMTHLSIPRASSTGYVVSLRIAGPDREGGSVELEHVVVCTGSDGVIDYMEMFPAEQIDTAIHRFDELEADGPTLTNRAWEVARRETQDVSDVDRVVAAFAPDGYVDDRRPGMRQTSQGADAIRALSEAIRGVGVLSVTADVIATRGDRLALYHRTFRGSQYDVDLLNVVEIGPDGRIQALVAFEPDDLDGAFAELDHRYLAGEGAPYADLLELAGRAVGLLNATDWDGFAAEFGHATFVDHRPASFGETDVASAISGAELASSRARFIEIPRITSSTMLARVQVTGASPELGEIEWAMVILATRDPLTFDVFDENDLDAAIETFDATRRTDGPTNEAVDVLVRRIEASLAGDMDAVEALIADACVSEDRRPGLRGEVQGREAVIETMQGVLAVGVTSVAPTPIATRGRRLALVRLLASGSRYETEFLALSEIDEEDRQLCTVLFAPEAIDEAFAELDARWLEAGELPTSAGPTFALFAAYNSRDWDRYRSLVADDFELVDHHLLYGGRAVSAEDLIVAMKALIELAPDMKLFLAQDIRVEDRGGVALISQRGTSTDGASVELRWFSVGTIDSLGRFTRIEVFAENDLARALARYDELTRI